MTGTGATPAGTPARSGTRMRCTYCGGRGGEALLEFDLRGVRYDYCDAGCATAHRQAAELSATLCAGCDDEMLGDTGACAEHLEPVEAFEPAAWRRAG